MVATSSTEWWSRRFAGAICGNIVGRNLVHRVVVHAALGIDVLAPWPELPIAVIMGARAELRIAILPSLCQDLHRHRAPTLLILRGLRDGGAQ